MAAKVALYKDRKVMNGGIKDDSISATSDRRGKPICK